MDTQKAVCEGLEHYEKKIYDQNQLIHISKALNSNLNLSSILDSILSTCLAQAQTFFVGLFLRSQGDPHEFRLVDNFQGFEIPDPASLSIPETSAFALFLADNARPWFIEELSKQSRAQDPDFAPFIEGLASLHPNLLLIPLKGKGRLTGFLILGPKSTGEAYSQPELAFLSDIASIAAIAVDNARLYYLATTDIMTGLKIHHFFQTRLREEMENSRILGQELSLIMTDIDHFKIFNDTYGHQTGDRVLGQVAQVLIDNSRTEDMPSRYGGEEFALILPRTSLPTAIRIADRIRLAVMNQRIMIENDDGQNKEERVTISVGVASLDTATDRDSAILINRCDKALYAAKHGGRNRVGVSRPGQDPEVLDPDAPAEESAI